MSNGTNSSLEQVLEDNRDKVEAILVLIIGVLSMIFNGSLLISMTVNPKLVFVSLGSYFIYNLGIADFITGINSIVYAINTLHPTELFDNDIKTGLLIIFWITIEVSFFTIFIMSTERLVAIVFPFKTALLLSKKRTIIYCVVVWIVSITFGIPMYMNNFINYVQLLLTVIFEIIVVAIVVEYIILFRHLRVLWENSKSRAVFNDSSNIEKGLVNKSKITELQREYEVTIIVVTLAVIIAITVFPYMIVLQVVLSYHLQGATLPSNHPANLFRRYYFPIELLNFVVNPIVYGWRLPKYRQAFLRTFCFGKKRAKNGNSYSSPKTLCSNCPSDYKEMSQIK